MNTYSIVLLDIDGTLVDSNDQISHNTKSLLNRLEKKEIPVVLCSARSPSGVEIVVGQVGLHSPIVCYGGSLIMDADRAIIEDRGIEGNTAVRFKQFAAREFPKVTVSTYMYDIWLVDSISDPNVQLVAQRNQCEPLVGELEAAINSVSHVHKLLCMGTPEEITRFQNSAAREFPELEFARSGTIYLEVLAKGISKCTAMEKLRTYYGLDAEQVVAMGDYFVDLEMLRHAGLGIAMGNAPDAVKEAAARVTTSCDEEGVYIALKNLRFTPPAQLRP
ncbi:Cof-type HAD-IIB family hydrolase [Pseudoflavonifractor phocaeensis]|uniref:Cof-type HAD-IIB family hydrolase n=1 Tax=Pseudoflavonifractor phocaeensis TaxID=1870988 RepID=UPI001F2F193C|nr:Cof-type HAD-IIB family hydrolase [Pseudoflavonifractor phocaeensis]MCF2661810.1 HAD family phosphatase [Pseudoflavonifractor phocaeensis]